jgi:hypothetical protein
MPSIGRSAARSRDCPFPAIDLPLPSNTGGAAGATRVTGATKAVAAAGHRLDAAALPAVLIENAAQRRDLHVEIVVLNDCCRPDGGDDLVSRKEITRPTEQHAEHVERTPADFDRNRSGTFIPPEQAVPVETEPLEQENVGREGRFQGLRLPAALNLKTF